LVLNGLVWFSLTVWFSFLVFMPTPTRDVLLSCSDTNHEIVSISYSDQYSWGN
jgi:hypothetical protein